MLDYKSAKEEWNANPTNLNKQQNQQQGDQNMCDVFTRVESQKGKWSAYAS